MTDGLGAQYLERKKVIEAEIARLQAEHKKGADFQADLQRQHSDIGRQLEAIKELFQIQAGKLAVVNELIEELKGEVTPTIPKEKNEKKK